MVSAWIVPWHMRACLGACVRALAQACVLWRKCACLGMCVHALVSALACTCLCACLLWCVLDMCTPWHTLALVRGACVFALVRVCMHALAHLCAFAPLSGYLFSLAYNNSTVHIEKSCDLLQKIEEQAHKKLNNTFNLLR